MTFVLQISYICKCVGGSLLNLSRVLFVLPLSLALCSDIRLHFDSRDDDREDVKKKKQPNVL